MDGFECFRLVEGIEKSERMEWRDWQISDGDCIDTYFMFSMLQSCSIEFFSDNEQDAIYVFIYQI